jgi:5-methylcytosine-specific restriction endonuclease McrA
MKKSLRQRESISPRLRFSILARDQFTCQCCGWRAPSVRLEVDHIYPRTLGGTTDAKNLITSCHDCNRGKSRYALPREKSLLEELSELIGRLRLVRAELHSIAAEGMERP